MHESGVAVVRTPHPSPSASPVPFYRVMQCMTIASAPSTRRVLGLHWKAIERSTKHIHPSIHRSRRFAHRPPGDIPSSCISCHFSIATGSSSSTPPWDDADLLWLAKGQVRTDIAHTGGVRCSVSTKLPSLVRDRQLLDAVQCNLPRETWIACLSCFLEGFAKRQAFAV